MIDRKKEICKRFNRAALTYDSYADVQHETALELATFLEGCQPEFILELGCGTGGFTRIVHDLFPLSALCCLDFSKAMVACAMAKNLDEKVSFHCVDCEEYLAAPPRQYDCICSNATFQWFQEPRIVFENIYKTLSRNGVFVASIFGPQCLSELGAGLQAVFGDEYRLPSPQFLGKKQLQTFLAHDFKDVTIQEKMYTRSYKTIYDLLRVIKYTGTGGYHALVPQFNKVNLQRLADWFMARGGLTVQYQIFFVKAVKGR